MMHVWHFTSSPVSYLEERGGVSNVVRALAIHTSEMGERTTVVCGDSELGKVRQDAGKVTVSASLDIITIRQHRTLLTGPVGELRSIISRMPAESVAHVHACFSAFADGAMHLLRSRAVPYIFSPHGKLSPGMMARHSHLKRIWWNLLSQRNVNAAVAIGLLSPEERHFAPGLSVSAPQLVIPNGYELPPDEPGGERIWPEPYILFLGYLDPRKQPRLLIEAFALSTHRQMAKLIFVGPDAYGILPELRMAACEFGLTDRVVFHGAAYGSEKWKILRNAAVVCLPSLGEGSPLVLIEAVGAEVPSLFSAECNMQAIAEAGAGSIVEGFDPATWAEQIDQLLGSLEKSNAMRERARAIKGGYAWSSVAARWVEAYANLSQRSPTK